MRFTMVLVGTETMTLLYTAGAYIANATIVEVTAVVAKNGGDWEFPYVFTRSRFRLIRV